MAKGKRTTDK